MDELILLQSGEVPTWRIHAQDIYDRIRRAAIRVRGARLARNRLNRAARRLAEKGPSSPPLQFVLPVTVAQLALGKTLEIDLPVAMLQTRMHDWLLLRGKRIHTGYRFLAEGDWTPLLTDAEPTAVMREAIQLRACGLDYRKTGSYARYLEMMDAGYRIVRNRVLIDCRERLDAYFERYVALYKSIEEHGVLRLEETWNRDLPGRTAPHDKDPGSDDADIGVAIGPDGEAVVLPGAKHRLAVATVLELPSAPVEVRMVHAGWLHSLDRGDDWCARIGQGIMEFAARANAVSEAEA